MMVSECDDKISECFDDNPKIVKVKYSTGSLNRDDTWNLCFLCSKKAEFQKWKISEESLEVCN